MSSKSSICIIFGLRSEKCKHFFSLAIVEEIDKSHPLLLKTNSHCFKIWRDSIEVSFQLPLLIEKWRREGDHKTKIKQWKSTLKNYLDIAIISTKNLEMFLEKIRKRPLKKQWKSITTFWMLIRCGTIELNLKNPRLEFGKFILLKIWKISIRTTFNGHYYCLKHVRWIAKSISQIPKGLFFRIEFKMSSFTSLITQPITGDKSQPNLEEKNLNPWLRITFFTRDESPAISQGYNREKLRRRWCLPPGIEMGLWNYKDRSSIYEKVTMTLYRVI